MRFAVSMLLAVAVARGQSFEVASIRPSLPDAPRSFDYGAGGRFNASNQTLRDLILEGYGLRGFQLSGGPDWSMSDPFTIAAKSETASTKEQMRASLRALLANRFLVTLHKETREAAVYALVLGKKGPLMVDAKPDQPDTGIRFRGMGRLVGIGATVAQMAVQLSDIRLNGSTILDRPVIDRTGLPGTYNFSLEWSDGTTENPINSSIFTAIQDQLGLKLEIQKLPVDFYTIERAAKPTDIEVATVKLGAPLPGDAININLGTIRNGTLTLTNATLSDCLKFAYELTSDTQIAGPDWMRDKNQRYDVVAKASPDTPRPAMLQMLQALLIERFQIAMHHEPREMSYYALVPGKKIKLRASTEPAATDRTVSGRILRRQMPMTMLATLLARFELHSVVLDQTGLSGNYAVDLEWAPANITNPDTATGPSLFTAVQEQLGLKLEAKRGPVDVFVIDHAEKIPAEN